MEQNSCRRPWRKLVKKLQRKRKRQKLAHQRDKEFEEAELERLKDPLYKSWLEQQEIISRQKEQAEENQSQEQEELWLRRELLAQKQFKRDELSRLEKEAKLEEERLKQEEKLKILEEERQKKRDEIKLQVEKAGKEFDDIMINMQEYLDDNTMKTPPRIDCVLQSRPGVKSCDFFDKTNCCRYGAGCTFNHKRPMLSKIILIKHFFQHPLLEQQEHDEYSGSDSVLELNESDLRDSYDEFCEDVWPVFKEFGSIINFRTARNVQAHLRGHVFVEYLDKRSALKAFINLQNRYYSSKRLFVEFSNVQQWRTGVCGLSLDRKCPKGFKCNYLHIMQNKDDVYNQPIPKTDRASHSVSNSTRTVRESPIISWNSEDTHKNKSIHSHNWRWSESPEIELKTKNKKEEITVNAGAENKNSIKSSDRKSLTKLGSDSPDLYRRNIKQTRSRSPSRVAENKNFTKSSQRKSRRSRSNTPKFRHKTKKQPRSKTQYSDRDKNSAFESPSSSTSKTICFASEKQIHSKSKRKSKHKSKESKKSKAQEDTKKTKKIMEEKQRYREKTNDKKISI